MAIPEKVTGIPYIDYAIDDARKGINELLGIKPSDSTEDVIIKEIQGFPFREVSPLGHVPYNSILKPQAIENVLNVFQDALIQTYDKITQDLTLLGSNGSLSAEAMTLSDGSTPIVDALNELKNYITAEQASVKGKCEKIIIQAENRQREEIQSFRKLFSNRRSFLDEKIREREMKISAWQEEIRKIDLLDLIPAHAIASRISYATKIEKYIEDNQKDYQEIQQLGIIGDTLGQEVIKV